MQVAEKKKLIAPELRFGEFDGDWKHAKLGQLAELTSSKRVYLSDYVENGIPFYRGKEITELRAGKTPDDILYISEKAYYDYKEKYGAPEKDQILITAVGTLGNVYRIKGDHKFYFKDGNLIWLRKIKASSEFMEVLLEVNKRSIDRTSIGSTQRALTMVELRKLSISLPSLPEQKKIADFLSAVDARVQHLNRKKELIAHYKKGVLQKLFSQELRFKRPDGTNYPDWEQKRLGEIAIFAKGKGISKNDIEPGGTLKCIRYGELYTTYSETISEVVSSTNVLASELFLSNASDLIIPSSGETHVDLATASCVMQKGIALGGDLNVIRTNHNSVFLAYYLNNAKKLDIARLAQGNSVVHLYSKHLKELKLNVLSMGEQQKIADFLSALDKKIEAVSTQIAKTQQFKKGLLQKMFV